MTNQPAPLFKINDTVYYAGDGGGNRYVFLGYVGKTGKQAIIARLHRDGDAYPVVRVWVSSLRGDR